MIPPGTFYITPVPSSHEWMIIFEETGGSVQLEVMRNGLPDVVTSNPFGLEAVAFAGRQSSAALVAAALNEFWQRRMKDEQ